MADPRLRDVAVRAGVSMTTASYVLRNAPAARISSATRARVRQAADDIGYHPPVPHQVCGGMLLVVPEPTERIAPGLVAALTDAAWARGLATVLLPGTGTTAREAAVAVREEGLRTVGVVRVADGDGDDRPEGTASFAPTVLIDLAHRSARGAVSEAVVRPHDRQAARQVAAVLQAAGHDRPALVTGDRDARLASLWCAGFAEVLPGRLTVIDRDLARGGDTPAPLRSPLGGAAPPTALVWLDEPAPTSVGLLARRLGSAPGDLAVVVRGGAGRAALDGEGYLRVALPVAEMAEAALAALDRLRAPSGGGDRNHQVTRVRFRDESFGSPPGRVAARAHLQAVETAAPAAM